MATITSFPLETEVLGFASQAEAEAGTDNTKVMTPLRTAQAVTARSGGTISYEIFGLVGDGSDEAVALQAFFDAVVASGGVGVLESGKTYLTSVTLNIDDDIELRTSGPGRAKIKATASTVADPIVEISGTVKGSTTMTTGAQVGTNTFTVLSAANIAVGDLVEFQSTRLWYHDSRPTATTPLRKGELHRVKGVSGLTITTEDVLFDGYEIATTHSGTAQAGGAKTITLAAAASASSDTYRYYTVRITGGTGVGQERLIVGYVGGTRVATVYESWVTNPDNTSTYTIDEAVTVISYSPIKVKIDNIDFEHVNANGADTYCVRTRALIDSEFTKCRFADATLVGLLLRESYNTLIDDPYFSGINSTTQGYGFQSQDSTKIVVRNPKGWGCRRLVDFSGTIPSSVWLVDNPVYFGGGTQEDGSAYGPGGVENYGVGTHGTSRHGVIRGGILGNLSRNIIVRGRDTIVDGIVFFGDGNKCIDASYGEGLIVQNCKQTIGILNLDGAGTPYTGGSNINNFVPETFVNFQNNWGFGGPVVIRNNSTERLKEAFITLTLTGAVTTALPFFEVQNNTALLTAVSGGDAINFIKSDTAATLTAGRSRIANNNIIARTGTYTKYVNFTPATGVEIDDSVIGSTVQAYNAALTSLAALGTAANKGIYATAEDTFAEFDLTAAGRAMAGAADAAAQSALLDATIAPVFANITSTPTTLAGYGITDARAAAAALKVPYLLGMSNTAVSHTGDTNETALATIQVPANAMGANGGLRVTTAWAYTNSGNIKNPRVRLGGISGTNFLEINLSTTAFFRDQREISNAGSASSQVGSSTATSGGWGITSVAHVTSAIDTTANVDLVISGQLASAGETITLLWYRVELLVP